MALSTFPSKPPEAEKGGSQGLERGVRRTVGVDCVHMYFLKGAAFWGHSVILYGTLCRDWILLCSVSSWHPGPRGARPTVEGVARGHIPQALWEPDLEAPPEACRRGRGGARSPPHGSRPGARAVRGGQGAVTGDKNGAVPPSAPLGPCTLRPASSPSLRCRLPCRAQWPWERWGLWGALPLPGGPSWWEVPAT